MKELDGCNMLQEYKEMRVLKKGQEVQKKSIEVYSVLNKCENQI